MKGRIIGISVLLSALILFIVGFFFYGSKDSQDVRSQQIVAVNELEQLALRGDKEALSKQSARLQEELRLLQINEDGNIQYFALCGICILFVIIVFCYVYYEILRPFDKMKTFAREIAQGDFDVPLEYERSNYFGDFTWAFDSMRREITKSRSCEREAIENNKTVIATLSHDIKTPIASIRAYAEGLEANMDRSMERRMKYISVLMRKCDEVSRLTDDLLLHSVSDLDKLKISVQPLELCSFMRECVSEIGAEQDNISLCLPEEGTEVWADRSRFMQVCENLVNNSRKYAKTGINLSIDIQEDFAVIHFRDYGNGIPDEDMPFIFDKFYRGKNSEKEHGSGLGLYIVKYIVEKMGGKVLLHNHSDGLEAVVFLRVRRSL